MTTTPLKTASRVLSFATLMVAGFSAWVAATQTLAPREPTQQSISDVSSDSVSTPAKVRQDERSPATPNNFATHTSVGTESQPTSVRSARDNPRASNVAAVEPVILSSRDHEGLVTRKDSRPLPYGRGSSLHSRTASPIQPEVGRAPLSARAGDTQTDPLNEFDSPAANVRNLAASSRVESRLATMQQQIGQLAQLQSNQKAQAQSEQQADDLQQAKDLIDQLQKERDAGKLEKLMQDVKDLKGKSQSASNGKKRIEDDDAEPGPPEEEALPTGPKRPGMLRAEPMEGKSERLSIQFQDAEISEALSMLGQLSGMNILVGRGVTGKVPAANLQDVTAEQALDAITKSLGYVFEKEGSFVFVSTPGDALLRKQADRKVMTKVFRPKYISVKDLQALVTPLLTKPGGLIAVTNPAESGLEQSPTKAGGNSLSQTDALLVVDFPEVLARVDTILTEIDVPPAQVLIEAMILSVKLTEEMRLGVNFALLGDKSKQLVTSGNGNQLNAAVGLPGKDSILPATEAFLANTAGLKYGFLTGDVSGFIEALESLTDTSVIASPSVRVLNKQRAELIIGERLGYTTTTFNGTQSIQSINFLEVGTKLLLRPYVAQDGLVRMEIHPERSDGTIDKKSGLPSSRTTEVTSNVMVRDGTTIVIGGLIEEQATQATSRVPLLGALPVVGNLFKTRDNSTTRTELIVLLTPRVIHEFGDDCEGQQLQGDNERRHEEFRNKLSKIGRTGLANIEYEHAARKFEEGDYTKARFHIEQSLRQNRTNPEVLRLRDQIDVAIAAERTSWLHRFRRKPPEQFHRVPATASSTPPRNAVFEQDFSIPIPSSDQPPPPTLDTLPASPLAPAVTPDAVLVPLPPADK